MEGLNEDSRTMVGSATELTPTPGLKYPFITGEETSILYSPSFAKCFLIRHATLIAVDRQSGKAEQLSEQPVSAIASDGIRIFFSSGSTIYALDPESRFLKPIISTTGSVESLEIDWMLPRTLTTPGVLPPTGLQTTQKHYVYFTSGRKVIKENIANSFDKETIEIAGAEIYAIDVRDNSLYFVIFGQNIIREKPIGGNRAFIVRKAGEIVAMQVDHQRNKLYYADSGKGQISSYDMINGTVEIIYSDLKLPSRLELYSKAGSVPRKRDEQLAS